MSFLSLALMTLATCDTQIPTENGLVAPEDRYALEYRTPIDTAPLAARLSLIAPVNSIYFSRFIGMNEFNVFALYHLENEFSGGTINQSYIAKGNFLRFKPSSKYDEATWSADLIDFKSGKAVGKLQYNNRNDFPNAPRRIVDLCTGAYESVCTLSYNSEAKLFNLKLNPEKS